MLTEVTACAAEISEEFGPDVDEAMSRWEEAGGPACKESSGVWLSVAFLFARRLRSTFSL